MNRQRPPDLQALIDALGGAKDGRSASRLQHFRERLYESAHRRLGPHQALRRALDSEDLAQDVLLELMRKVHLFEGDTWPEFLAFTDAVLRQHQTDLARFHSRRKRSLEHTAGEEDEPTDSDSPGPGSRVVQAEQIKRARRMLAGLPVELRRPLQMRLDGMDYDEIARELGLRTPALRKRVQRALTELRERW